MKLKNGLGPAPIKTEHGWLHLAHGVRNTAAGLRYVLYMFMTDLNDITKVIYKPAGYFWRRKERKESVMFQMWYSAMDGYSMMMALYLFIMLLPIHGCMWLLQPLTSLLDYVMNTPADGFSSAETVKTLNQIIENNQSEADVEYDSFINRYIKNAK